jgi:PAS domain S-box-containing protein
MNEDLHSLLKKQIKKYFKVNGTNNLPEDIDRFLYSVSNTYLNFDEENQKLEHSLNTTSTELKQTNSHLRISLEDLESEIRERTKELEKLNLNLKKDNEERKRIESALTKNLVKTSKISNYEAIISSVTQSVHQSLKLKDVLEYAVDSISKNIDSVMHATIYLIENDEAVMQVHRGFSKSYIKKASRIPRGKGLIWKTVLDNKTQFVLDTSEDKTIGPAGIKMGISSYISIPLINKSETIGVLAVTSSVVNGFSEDDLRVAEIVAQQVQAAIDNARKAEALSQSELQIKENLKELSIKSRYESIISSIVQGVHKSIRLDEVLDNAVAAIKKNLKQCSHVSIYLTDDQYAVMRAFRGYEKQDYFISVVKSIPKPKGFTWNTILNNKTVICDDIDKDKNIGPAGRKVGSKSYICVPLTAEEETVGTINLHSKKKNAFSKDDIKLIEDVSRQIGVAILNAKKAEELNSRNIYLEILNKLSELVHKSLDMEEVYKIALDEIISIENVDIAGVYLVDSNTGDAIIQDHRNFPKAYLKKASRISRGVGLTWKIIETGELHHIENVQNDPDLGPAGKKMGWHCVLGIPLVINNIVEGVVWFISYDVQKYADEQIELFTLITNQISISISKAKLYEDLSKKNIYENILGSVTQSVHKSIYLREVFDNAVDALSKNVDSVKHSAIYMLEGNSAVMKAHRGFTKKYRDRANIIPYGKGLVWRTVLDEEARYIPDTKLDDAIGEAGIKMGIKSYLSVPIYNQESIIGVQVITSSKTEAFDQDELILLEKISIQIQSAIDNAQKAEALFKSEEYNKLLIENIKDYAIFMLDNDGYVENWNTGAEKLTGYKENKILGQPFSKFYFSEDNESGIPSNGLKFASLENAFEHDAWIVKNDKTSFWANVIINSIRDIDGDLIGYSIAMHDITEKKNASEELEEYASKLERSNEELEQFAYVASHDLQEPLRMVGSYLGLLERRYKDKIDKDASDFIYYAVDGAKRMQTLINDLLSYSRISSRGKPFEIINCKDLINGILKNLEIAIKESGAIIELGYLPDHIVVDKTQISQLFQNLTGNALKFCRNRKPEIKISAEDDGKCWVFSFKDNGIGIEPEYFERIFVIFQRLHGKAEYAGTGIGLAICKKIVLRHDGDIWVNSEPDKGSTFYFTIPKRGGI